MIEMELVNDCIEDWKEYYVKTKMFSRSTPKLDIS